MLYISLSVVFIKKVNNFNKTWLKHIEYAESKFRTFDFVICKFIVVYMNNKFQICARNVVSTEGLSTSKSE